MMRYTALNSGISNSTSAVQRSKVYASAEDFCAIFREDSDSLYTLALSLSGSHELAHKIFVAALEDCRNGSTVFQEWAKPWSRRAVIKNAIRLLEPIQSGMNNDVTAELESIAGEMHPAARWFFLLDRLERFVFVISVLEGYTVRECAALLNNSPRQVEQAWLRALQQVAGEQNVVPVPYVNNSDRAASPIFTQH